MKGFGVNMDAILRRIDNFFFTFFFLLFLFIKFIVSIQLSYANEKILCAPRRLGVKAARNIEKCLLHCSQYVILHNDFICTAACFTVKIIAFQSFAQEVSCILVVPLHCFYDVRKQSSPNSHYYVKALTNLHQSVGFQLQIMRLSLPIDL